jgi:hypothetical protein
MVEITLKYNELEKIESLGDPYTILKQRRKNKIDTETPDNSRLKESDSFEIKFNNIKDRVKSILKFDKLARKNDLWLMLLYYNKMGYIKLQIDLKDFSKINPPESISRARRSLFQEIKQGKHPDLKFLIDKDMDEVRKEYKELYHDYFQDKKSGYESTWLK